MPLAFVAGDACQFDWSHEQVELAGVLQTIKVAHFRLAYSRQMFVVAYPRETQEMVLEAHNQAFAFCGGVPARLIYDNLKTVVDAIFTSKERKFNRHFLCLVNHYLLRASHPSPNSMPGWHIAAGSWRNAVTPRKASAPFKSARFPIHRDLLGIDWNETPLA